MVQHILIGGGPAATNAAITIREFDGGQSRITLISDEPTHSRMALPYWIAGKIPREQTYTGDAAYFDRMGVEARIGARVAAVNPQAKSIRLTDGAELKFDNLLIATGSSPIAPRISGIDLPGVQPLWSLAHSQQLLESTAHLTKPRVVLIGAGFVGFIVLNAMFKRGWDLTVVERESQVLPRMLDRAAADVVRNWLRSRDVNVHVSTTAEAITQGEGDTKVVQLADGTKLVADLVIVATGIKPNLELIEGSGIAVDQGILVDDRMQTNYPGIYAAGDIAQGPVLFGDGPALHPIQPTAVEHGRIAGANMAGRETHYPGSLLMNVVDVCGLQCASFGAWNDPGAEVTTIVNESSSIYRKLLWRGDQPVGAIFTGRANDMGMLTDVGMVKGILQTQTRLGAWKKHLTDFPFDIRRAYVASGVAARLVQTTLLGRPTVDRRYHFDGSKSETRIGPAHGVYVGTKS